MSYRERHTGENPLIATRKEGELSVDKKKRKMQILEILNDAEEPMSAREIAVEMERRGYAPTNERNLSAPRICEMLKTGILDCVGDKICQYTNVTVGVFQIRKKED